MSKVTKKEFFKFCDENNDAINELQSQSDSTDFLLAVLIQQLKDSGVIDEISPEPKPQLKQLDQDDDIAKELLEVDLSSELTGSDLCRKMLARGDKYVMCLCWDSSYADIEQVVDVIKGFESTAYKKLFAGNRHNWKYAVPINNQGEPLTASEVGL